MHIICAPHNTLKNKVSIGLCLRVYIPPLPLSPFYIFSPGTLIAMWKGGAVLKPLIILFIVIALVSGLALGKGPIPKFWNGGKMESRIARQRNYQSERFTRR